MWKSPWSNLNHWLSQYIIQIWTVCFPSGPWTREDPNPLTYAYTSRDANHQKRNLFQNASTGIPVITVQLRHSFVIWPSRTRYKYRFLVFSLKSSKSSAFWIAFFDPLFRYSIWDHKSVNQRRHGFFRGGTSDWVPHRRKVERTAREGQRVQEIGTNCFVVFLSIDSYCNLDPFLFRSFHHWIWLMCSFELLNWIWMVWKRRRKTLWLVWTFWFDNYNRFEMVRNDEKYKERWIFLLCSLSQSLVRFDDIWWRTQASLFLSSLTSRRARV